MVLEKYCIFAKEYLVEKKCQSLINTINVLATIISLLLKYHIKE